MAIGVRVGVAVGVNVGPAVGASSDEVSGTWGGNAIVGIGDSNFVGQGVGQGTGVDGEFDPTFTVMSPVGGPYNKHYSQSSNDPVPYATDVSGGVGPYNVAGVPNIGMQTVFAAELRRAGYTTALWEHSISGIKALQFVPSASFPTLPAGTLNLWNSTLSRVDGLGGQVKAMVWIIGGNDGFNSTDANALQANLAAMRTAARTKWGTGLVIVLVRNPAFQGIASTVPFLSTITTAQDNFAAANPGDVVEVFTDDLTGHSDHLHYDGNSYTILGQRVAYALLDKLGIARVRPSISPGVVGWAPLYTSAAGAFSVVGPGCAIDKDLEVMTVFSQTASGANNAIGTPTSTSAQPWTSRGTATSTDGTSTTRMAIFTRPVTAADLTTGHGAMPSSTVPNNSNPINGARICVMRSSTAGSTPSVAGIQTGVNNAFQTGLTLPTLTTGGANRTILGIAGGYRTNANANPITMAFTNPTGPVNLFGSNRTVVVDFVTHGVWSALQAGAGAIGNTAVTFGLATLACGAALEIAP